MSFPKNFMWGVATSSYQIEGAVTKDGRGVSIWDTFCDTPGKVVNGDSGATANDHYHLYEGDIQLMKSLGVKAYRFSISWPRLFPNGDAVPEPRGFAFYNRLIDSLLNAGIEPVATLYHWDLPQALQDKGGWVNRDILKAFEFYSRAVAEAFGDRVKRFSPINEPWVVSWLGYGYGVHAPGIKDFDQAIVAAHHTVAAHNLSVRAIKSVCPDALVGPVLNQTMAEIDDPTDPLQVHAAEVLDANHNLFWMDGIFRGQYSELIWDIYGDVLRNVVMDGDLEPCENDWLGINFYMNSRIGKAAEESREGEPGIIEHYAGYAVEDGPQGDLTDMGWPITPHGIGDLLLRWTREYGDQVPQMFITENGVAFGEEPDENGLVHDYRRVAYLNDHLVEVERAIDGGADVGGYFQWSLMDNFEWAEGFAKRFGIVHVDYDSQVRTVKESGKFYARVIETNGQALQKKERISSAQGAYLPANGN